MIIDGYDYHFAYTVGAYCDIFDLHLNPAKTMAEQVKITGQMAVIMSKAYEDRKKLEDPNYKVNYLTLAQVRGLSINEAVDILMPEVNEAVKAGAYVSVEAETKKDESAVRV